MSYKVKKFRFSRLWYPFPPPAGRKNENFSSQRPFKLCFYNWTLATTFRITPPLPSLHIGVRLGWFINFPFSKQDVGGSLPVGPLSSRPDAWCVNLSIPTIQTASPTTVWGCRNWSAIQKNPWSLHNCESDVSIMPPLKANTSVM